ncbi:hypothetical protein BD626DRAFT_541377 [Schizophyllum amplum]|uniref:Uncharacterized protein n=1 Tax=Schizophyllum amplum TaxID=97359 RepID=A0A550BUZ8_9AGAR|nr:hypothetical protein BD626DRAFT_541377 [Auriculariopsis ampla]
MFQNFVDFVGVRLLRSGKAFSQYYVVPDKSFDLDALGLAAAENEGDEPPPPAAANDDRDEWEDLPEPAPTTPSPPDEGRPADHTYESDSPLSSLPSSPDTSRPPSPTRPAPASGLDHAISGCGRKRRRKEHGRKNRIKQRKTEPRTEPSYERQRRHAQIIVRSVPKHVEFNLRKAPATKTGFRARYEGETRRTFTRQELEEQGFVYFPWDGRETVPIVTPNIDGKETSNVVIACLAGRPSDGAKSGRTPLEADWTTATSSLADAIERQRSRTTFGKAARDHRRGMFGAQAQGISHGGGQLRPANLKHSKTMTKVLLFLVALPSMIRAAHFSSSVYGTWAPLIHALSGDTLDALLASDPDLKRNFEASVWACITINFGPRTVTFPHRDYANLAFGWCAITALGRFDPDKGGELILWDCKMIIRFPPGSTILIPSAILKHSNTRIALSERRYSVTQYTAGAIFRWVEHGFQLDKAYYASLSKAEAAKDAKTAAGRWRRGRAMFSKFDDLVEAAEAKLKGKSASK